VLTGHSSRGTDNLFIKHCCSIPTNFWSESFLELCTLSKPELEIKRLSSCDVITLAVTVVEEDDVDII
jgi:hypothetical protein